MKQIFEHYDKDKQGRINYRNFITDVLFQGQSEATEHTPEPPTLSNQPNSLKVETGNSHQKAKSSTPVKRPPPKMVNSNEVIAYIKEWLRGADIDSLISLAVRLKEMDAAKTHRLPLAKLETVLSNLNRQNIVLLLSHFNLPPEGQLNYAEFVYSLLDPPSPERTALISNTFAQFADPNAEATIEELLKRYRDNVIVPKTAYDRACALYCKFQSIDDGIFTAEDFEDFVSFLGFGFTSDQRFRTWILKGYGDEEDIRSNKSFRSREFQHESKSQFSKQEPLSDRLADIKIDTNIEPPKDAFKKSVAAERKSHQNRASQQPSVHSQHESTRSSRLIKEMELILLRIKRRLASRGPNGYLTFEKALRASDTDSDMMVSVHEFKKVIQNQRIDITDTEASMVFEMFDQEGTGLMNYPEFVYAIRGEVPPARQKLIDRVWEKVRIPGEQHTTYNYIKSQYKTKDHPDIRSGRRFEEDIVKELSQALLCVQDLNGVRSEEISKDDFVEYLQNQSAAIADDQLFETTLTSFWRLDSVNRIEDEYAGSKKRFDMKNNSNSYLIDHHRYVINGGSVSQNAPFGTYNEPTPYRQ